MASSTVEKMQDIDKEKLIELLIDELLVLRAKIGLSQEWVEGMGVFTEELRQILNMNRRE